MLGDKHVQRQIGVGKTIEQAVYFTFRLMIDSSDKVIVDLPSIRSREKRGHLGRIYMGWGYMEILSRQSPIRLADVRIPLLLLGDPPLIMEHYNTIEA